MENSEKDASSGNRTRAARVAGEHSTTEPTMLTYKPELSKALYAKGKHQLYAHYISHFILHPLKLQVESSKIFT